jgi:hypothetical protein
VVNRDEIFESVMDEFVIFNRKYLYKRTMEYLGAVEVSHFNNTPKLNRSKLVLNLTQIGMLYNIQPSMFAKGRFDNNLLDFLSKYRDKISFTILQASGFKKVNNHIGSYYLVRITITNVPSKERDLIGEFVANNLDKYSFFTRQTVSYEKNIDDERVINIKQLSDPDFIQRRSQYKDLTLLFGY